MLSVKKIMWWPGYFIMLSFLTNIALIDSCKKDYDMMGCYEERNPQNLLFNDRSKINWQDIAGYMQRLACKCGEVARREGYSGFALYYWGECYGRTETGINALTKVEHDDYLCIGDQTYTKCDKTENTHCIGGDYAEAVYVFKKSASEDIDGGFGQWQPWTACDKPCGSGMRHRERNCDNPEPVGKGKDCTALGDYTQSVACKIKDCPVHGGFGAWGQYTSCSRSCGGGIKSRSRLCNNPLPAYGGDDCEKLGPSTETAECNIQNCPVNGGYSSWSEYSFCSKTCSGGIQTRARSCNNPEPAHGGKDCSILGPSSESKSCNAHECPVNGGYSSWGSYGSCSVSCGGGLKIRTRLCNSPKPAYGGADCSRLGPDSESSSCSTHECPVNGGYSEWGEYSTCSSTCGGGIKTRKRSCDNPKPAHGGNDCKDLGPATESFACNIHECPVDGGYSEWNEYGGCSKSCGGGIKTRTRNCNNPAPAHGGNDCSRLGLSTESAICNMHECPVDGGYSKWTAYSQCSKSCGGGIKIRTRSCNSPAPVHGGKDCSSKGASSESASCNLYECPVNGGYSEWTEYSICSKSCGGGVTTRLRFCNNPEPAHGGRDCEDLGPRSESRSCNNHECPVHGGYGEWEEYSACSKSCGEGIKTRTRSCDNPIPAHGGKDCSSIGPAYESTSCNTHNCPVNGGYGDWAAFSSCSKSCGSGIKTRTRPCNNPVPADGGKDCSSLGPASESIPCNIQKCPVHGGYSEWGEYNACSKSCGEGIKTRARTCSNPTPAHGGKDCSSLGAASESIACNMHKCPVNGGYSEWGEYSRCSASCGGGIRTRERSCNNPRPAYGGSDCSGPKSESASCNTDECPVDGGYSEWQPYGACSKSCEGGVKTRTRSCNNPVPAHGGKDCLRLGQASESTSCNTHNCPVDGGYGEWGPYTICSKSCGHGNKTRTRLCNNPAPAYGGLDCSGLGPASEIVSCNINECRVPEIRQKILETSACKIKYTSFQAHGDGNVAYIDRHKLKCGTSNNVISMFRLQRSGNNMRYQFKCCKLGNSVCTSKPRVTESSDNGSGKFVHLDKLEVDCGLSGYISGFNVERNKAQDKFRYKYYCCNYQQADLKRQPTCYISQTYLTDDGKGKVYFLDRQAVSCRKDHALSAFVLERNSDHTKIRYRFRCCKLN